MKKQCHENSFHSCCLWCILLGLNQDSPKSLLFTHFVNLIDWCSLHGHLFIFEQNICSFLDKCKQLLFLKVFEREDTAPQISKWSIKFLYFVVFSPYIWTFIAPAVLVTQILYSKTIKKNSGSKTMLIYFSFLGVFFFTEFVQFYK